MAITAAAERRSSTLPRAAGGERLRRGSGLGGGCDLNCTIDGRTGLASVPSVNCPMFRSCIGIPRPTVPPRSDNPYYQRPATFTRRLSTQSLSLLLLTHI
jgi:hypothetical protein